MAAELTQDAVLHFLRSRGGSVPNAELLLYFRPFLRDHADRARNRELFKSFVNSVARVKQEDGVSHVVLQRRYRGSGESPSVSAQGNVHLSPLWNTDKPRNKSPEPKATQPGPVVLPAAGIVPSNNNNKSVEPNLTRAQVRVQQCSQPCPQAVHTGVPGRSSEPSPAPPREPTGLPEASTGREIKASFPPPEPRDPKLSASVPESSGRLSPLLHSRPPHASAPPVCPGHGGQAYNDMPQQRQPSPAKPVPPHAREAFHSPQPADRAPRSTARHRQSYRTALSLGDEEEEAEVAVPDRRASAPLDSAAVWGVRSGAGERSERGISQSSPGPVQLQGPGRGARSKEPHGTGPGQTPPAQPQKVSPKRMVPPQVSPERMVPPQVSPERTVPPQVSPERTVPPQVSPERTVPPQVSPERTVPPQVSPERTVPQIHIQDMDPGCRGGSEPQPRFRTGFPLLVHNLSGSSSSVEQSPRVGRVSSGWSSCEELAHLGGAGGAGASAREHQSGQSRQRSADEERPWKSRQRAWHHSTGDLYDDGADSSASSAPSPPALLRPAVARRQGSNLKRMCLSVGADLDQLMDEDDHRALGGSEAARLHRLHLISSSLSLGHVSSVSSLSSCSTPPRRHSLADLAAPDTPRGRRSPQSTPQHQEGSSRQSHVPLEEREHEWLVKAASGVWPDIYSLFREEPSLLHRRDFISGFTVLHWIAKHGDHRVLNTLWYGVEKAGLMFDTDAQSSCGYTSLHIAAMHNHKNIIRLLVNKFKANVSLRDAAGRKAWFYLPPGASPDLYKLLGAPAKAALGPAAVGQPWDAPQTHPQTKRRRRRHHFSSASGQRPVTFSGDAKVKRSSSLAAFLKHKSLQKIKAEWAI